MFKSCRVTYAAARSSPNHRLPLKELSVLYKNFLCLIHQLAPLDQSRKYTLEDCLLAEAFHYTVQAVADSLVPVYLVNTKPQGQEE